MPISVSKRPSSPQRASPRRASPFVLLVTIPSLAPPPRSAVSASSMPGNGLSSRSWCSSVKSRYVSTIRDAWPASCAKLASCGLSGRPKPARQRFSSGTAPRCVRIVWRNASMIRSVESISVPSRSNR